MIKKFVLPLLLGAAVMFGVIEAGRADAPGPVLLAQAGSSAGSAVTIPPFEPATETSTAQPPAPSLGTEDIAVVTKLYRGGQWFMLGIFALYIGLFAWAKFDKKHAFYATASLAAVALVVESIRKGETVNAQTMLTVLGSLGGVLIAGPGHVKA